MLDAHAYVMQVKLCKANTRGVTAVSGESENRSLPLGLGDGVSGESEISAETSFVYSVGSVLRV